MNSSATAAATGSSSSRFYFVVWLALGAAGIFYVTIASLAPEALHGAETSGIEAINTQVAALSSSMTQLKTHIESSDSRQQTFAADLDVLKGDVGGLKVKFADLASLDQSVSSRLSAIEGQPVPAPGAKASSAASNAPAPTLSIASKGAQAPKIEGVVMPDDSSADAMVPPDPTIDAVAPAKKPAKIASAAADAKPAAPPKAYAVDLAMSTSPDALKEIWQLYKDQHPDLFAGLTPRSVASGSNVRLLAGPFPSQAAAAAQCAKIRKEGVICTPTPLAGTPL